MEHNDNTNLSEILNKSQSFKNSLKNLSDTLQYEVNAFLQQNNIDITLEQAKGLNSELNELTEKSLKYAKLDKFVDSVINIINSYLNKKIQTIGEKKVEVFKDNIINNIVSPIKQSLALQNEPIR